MNRGLVEPVCGLPRVRDAVPDLSTTCRCGRQAVKVVNDIRKIVATDCQKCGRLPVAEDTQGRKRVQVEKDVDHKELRESVELLLGSKELRLRKENVPR